jgi:hypothetical protein
LYASPPRNLLRLNEQLEGCEHILFDLDVDYLKELQTECYTPLRNAELARVSFINRYSKLKLFDEITQVNRSFHQPIFDKENNQPKA